MGKTYRNFDNGASDKRNGKTAKKHARNKQIENKNYRNKIKREIETKLEEIIN